jgi:hypothetical protein
MAASATPATAKFVNGPIIMLAVGIFCVIGSGLWYFFGDFTGSVLADQQMTQNDKGVTQSNPSGGANVNVPGSGNTIVINPSASTQVRENAIYQAGVKVGNVFGGRRSPNDATIFEFVEITNANQFNPREPFQFEGNVSGRRGCLPR